MLSHVIEGSAVLLSPLESITAGAQSNSLIVWSENLLTSLHKAQQALSTSKTIVIPRPEDQLWIVTDGSVKMTGLGATLYALRNNKLHLAGFFSAKTRKHQVTWLLCEIEALSIASAIKHFAPYIIQSTSQTCTLTDSKPCVQSFEKLCRGQFSSSPRVTTFLSTVSRYQISLRHLAGSANLPSEFASRNAPRVMIHAVRSAPLSRKRKNQWFAPYQCTTFSLGLCLYLLPPDPHGCKPNTSVQILSVSRAVRANCMSARSS